MSEQSPPEQSPAEQSPQAAPGDWRPEGQSGPRASFGRRFVAALIDGILLGILYAVFLAIFDQTAAYGLYLVAGIVYYALLEGGATGQTLGKKALGIRVVDYNGGGSIGYGRGVVRYIGRILSSIPCLLGYLWMLWDKEKQTWHDKLSTSVVVPESYYPVSSS
jgi:uncharacterized RDD family membrane protein YckC